MGPCGKVDVVPSIFEIGGEIIRMAFNNHWILHVGVDFDFYTIVTNLIWIHQTVSQVRHT